MRTRLITAITGTAFAALASMCAWAAPITVLDPTFDVFMPSTNTIIADNQQTNTLFLVSPGAGGPQTNVALASANPGGLNGNFGDVPAGWIAPGVGPNSNVSISGRYRHDVQFAGPSTGTKAMILGGASFVGSLHQILAGTPVLPNKLYTLKFDVSDGDPTSFSAGGADISAISPTIVGSLLAGGPLGTNLGGTVSFAPPGNGATSAYTLSVATGAVVPAGDLTIQLIASGGSAQPDATVTLTYFDNVTLDVVPDPCSAALLGLGSLALACVRRPMAKR